jgi:uncharacterized protein
MNLRFTRLLAAAVLALLLAAAGARADIALFGTYWANVARQTARNDVNEVRRLLEDQHDPNEEDDKGRTGLLIAAMDDNLPIAGILLKAGAHPDAADSVGNTPLHYAAQRNRITMVRLLLDAGAAVDPQNHDGLTPLMMAATRGYFMIVEALLGRGANVAKTDFTGRDALSWATDNHQAAVMRLLQRAAVTR